MVWSVERRGGPQVSEGMKNRYGLVGLLIGLLMPVVLILGGAALAAVGVMQASLFLIVTGLVVAAAGVLWGVVMLNLSNPFF